MLEAHAAERKTLFVVGSYHIGKERAFFGAARAMGFKIWCHAAKKRVSTDIENSCPICCSCTGQSAMSLASCMLFSRCLGHTVCLCSVGIPSAETQVFASGAPKHWSMWPVIPYFGCQVMKAPLNWHAKQPCVPMA